MGLSNLSTLILWKTFENVCFGRKSDICSKVASLEESMFL